MKSGAWDKKTFAKGMELEGKTLGILGVGRIGRLLLRRDGASGGKSQFIHSAETGRAGA